MPPALGLGNVLGIGGKDGGGVRPDGLRHRGQRAVLLLGWRQRQRPGGGTRGAAQIPQGFFDIARWARCFSKAGSWLPSKTGLS